MNKLIVPAVSLLVGLAVGWFVDARKAPEKVLEGAPSAAKSVAKTVPDVALGELRSKIKALEAELAKPRPERKKYFHELKHGDYMSQVSFMNANGDDVSVTKLSLDKIPDMETLKTSNPALYNSMMSGAAKMKTARHQDLKRRIDLLQNADTSALTADDRETLASYCRLLVDDGVLEDMMSATYPHTPEQRQAANEERARVWKERDEVGRDVRDMLTLSVLKSAGVSDETAQQALKTAVILYESTARVGN